jgi:hypothetical protein
MSIIECRLAVEKECDGKPFTVCEVGTWFYVELSMLRSGYPDKEASAARKLFDAFGTGSDKTERGATLEELKALPSNGMINIIPKTADKFIAVSKWKE